MPRPQSEGRRVNKYDKNFLKCMKNKYGANYELHCEDVDIIEWPGHSRYTEQFKKKQKITMQRKFGNKKVNKYKHEFIKFLEKNFSHEDHLNNLENRCNTLIRQIYPDNLRYSAEYLIENEKSAKRVKDWRLKHQTDMNFSLEDFNQPSIEPVSSVISSQPSVQTIDSGYPWSNVADFEDSDNESNDIQVGSNLNALNTNGNKNDSYLNTNLKNPSNSVDSRLIVQLDHVSLNEKENFGLNEFSQNLMNELDDLDISYLINEEGLNNINQCEFDQYDLDLDLIPPFF